MSIYYNERNYNKTVSIKLNNPYSLFDVKWSDKKLNNLSWLLSNGQANPKTIYPAAYDLLLKEYNGSTDETEIIDEIKVTFRKGTETGIKIITDKAVFDSVLSKTGTAWYYVLDVDNEIFYLPQSNGFIQFGGSGEYVEAGLPNITGDWLAGLTLDVTVSHGAIKSAFEDSRNYNISNYLGGRYFFDASLSNSIYGNSTTVQPPAIKGYLYFYVGESVQNTNLIDVSKILEELSTKITLEQAVNAPMPQYSYTELEIGASGTYYTAPKAGWYTTRMRASAADQWVLIYTVSSHVGQMVYSSSAKSAAIVSCPVGKGDKVYLGYTFAGNDNNVYLRFVAAKGSE